MKTMSSLTLIDGFHPRMRNEQQEAINAGELRKREEIELVQPAELRPLALLRLLLLVIGGVFFGLLTFAAYTRQTHTGITGIGGWGLLLWLVINIVGYILILPLHEVIHAAAFTLWGGKPYFGARLPYALYCGAKGQLFHRNQYLVVGLPPLVVITLARIILTLVSPALASYTIFATAGNISGAPS